jgi:hypothetical protein
MSLDMTLRATEILLALAFIQQSAEHMRAAGSERRLFFIRMILSVLLLTGFYAPFVCLALVIFSLFILDRFQGPYNGGSDRMGLLILCCLCLALFMPAGRWRDYVFGYLAAQVLLSYVMAGWAKITNPEWRTGRALQDVFLFSAYPASESLRAWADWPRLLWTASWAVMLFELFFPLALATRTALMIGLALALAFHFANACLFGLNRFFWIWLAAYPSLLWLQERLF